MYKSDVTIYKILNGISEHEYVLPAIQRELVWQPEQMCQFFDSLMQGYPFGTFLFWRIDAENSHEFKFYDFVRHYHERDNPHCPPVEVVEEKSLIAVLDGQQRLTALNIGLTGSAAWKLPRKWWGNPDAFPAQHLYLNLLYGMEQERTESGEQYQFEFMVEEKASSTSPSECWFKVSDIMTIGEAPDMLNWLTENTQLKDELLNFAFRVLNKMYRVVHDGLLISYYEETSQDIDRVLHVFIRTNSGGTELSYSDLLLSIAISQWSIDARKEIRKWLIHSILKSSGIWGSGLDTLLTALREVINEHGNEQFPEKQIRSAMSRRGKSLAFEEEEIEELVDMRYGDKRLFGLLSLLFDFVDLRNLLHIDHIFPKSCFTDKKLNEAEIISDQAADYKDWSNRLANLQLLLGQKNLEKQQKLPSDWLNQEFLDESKREAYINNHCLGEVPETMSEFSEFYNTRRDLLKGNITQLLF